MGRRNQLTHAEQLAHPRLLILSEETSSLRSPTAEVLSSHGIVRREKDTYKLDEDVANLSGDERVDLIAICGAAVAKFKAARGAAIWEHRGMDFP